MSKKDSLCPKINDFVRIDNPEMFVRCGYPIGIQDVRELIRKNNMSDITDLINKVIGQNDCDILPRLLRSDGVRETSIRKIIDVLAYEKLRNDGFGGRERTIHTLYDENQKGKIYQVIGTKRCVTGTYVPPSGGYEYYSGEYEYEPAYLMNDKSHRILILSIEQPNPTYFADLREIYSIEDCHVSKVEK